MRCVEAASGSGRKVVKFVRCPIQVQTDSETGEPVSFNYRGMNYAVSEVLRNWRDFTLLDKEMSGRGGSNGLVAEWTWKAKLQGKN